MEALLLFLIILLFILQGIAKLIQRASPQRRPEPQESFPPEVKEYFEERETIDLPRMVKKKKVKETVEESKKEKEPVLSRAPMLEKTPPFLISSRQTIKQGIILSTILGPPKAKQPLR